MKLCRRPTHEDDWQHVGDDRETNVIPKSKKKNGKYDIKAYILGHKLIHCTFDNV